MAKNKDLTKALVNVLERIADAIEEVVPRTLGAKETRKRREDRIKTVQEMRESRIKAAYWLKATTRFWIAKAVISIAGLTAVTILGAQKVLDQGTLGMLMAAVVASLFVPPALRE